MAVRQFISRLLVDYLWRRAPLYSHRWRLSPGLDGVAVRRSSAKPCSSVSFFHFPFCLWTGHQLSVQSKTERAGKRSPETDPYPYVNTAYRGLNLHAEYRGTSGAHTYRAGTVGVSKGPVMRPNFLHRPSPRPYFIFI